MKRAVWALTLMTALAGCGSSRRAGDPLKPGYNAYSKEQDVELGRKAAAQVMQQADVVRNQELQSYVSRIGGELARQPQADNYPYSFTMLNDRSINAFALPGGPTFVFSGLLPAAENEAQFAGVLAHEISHVALRHATHEMSKASLLELPAALAGAVIGRGSLGAQVAQAGLGLGISSVLLKYSREAESEADAMGAHLMAQAGYNPIEMARFFEKLEAQGGSAAPQFLSDHPNPGNRVKAVEAEIATLPQRNYNANTGLFPREKQLVAELPPPRAPQRQ